MPRRKTDEVATDVANDFLDIQTPESEVFTDVANDTIETPVEISGLTLDQAEINHIPQTTTKEPLLVDILTELGEILNTASIPYPAKDRLYSLVKKYNS